MKREHVIPAAAMDLAKRGELIDAIKLTREQTGLACGYGYLFSS